MTDSEFDLLDELYFVIHFDEVFKKLNWEKDVLIKELFNLLEKKWIKILNPKSMLEITTPPDTKEYAQCCFLATKKGLMAHNSK